MGALLAEELKDWATLEWAADWFAVGTNIEDWKREAVAKKLREMAAAERKKLEDVPLAEGGVLPEPVGLTDK